MNFFRRNIGGGGGGHVSNGGGGSADNLISNSHSTSSKLQDMYNNKFGSSLTASNMVDYTSPCYDQKENLAKNYGALH